MSLYQVPLWKFYTMGNNEGIDGMDFCTLHLSPLDCKTGDHVSFELFSYFQSFSLFFFSKDFFVVTTQKRILRSYLNPCLQHRRKKGKTFREKAVSALSIHNPSKDIQRNTCPTIDDHNNDNMTGSSSYDFINHIFRFRGKVGFQQQLCHHTFFSSDIPTKNLVLYTGTRYILCLQRKQHSPAVNYMKGIPVHVYMCVGPLWYSVSC